VTKSNEAAYNQIVRRLKSYCFFGTNSQYCYLLVLLARKKENPELTEKHKIEKCNRYILHTEEDVEKSVTQMIMQAEQNPQIKYRAYVSVNKRDLRKAIPAFQHKVTDIVDQLFRNNSEAHTTAARLGSEWKSVLAQQHCKGERRILIDIDISNKTEEGQKFFAEALDLISEYKYPDEDYGPALYAHWPTLNGYAIVTAGFDVEGLLGEDKRVEIKKDDYLYLDLINVEQPEEGA